MHQDGPQASLITRDLIPSHNNVRTGTLVQNFDAMILTLEITTVTWVTAKEGPALWCNISSICASFSSSSSLPSRRKDAFFFFLQMTLPIKVSIWILHNVFNFCPRCLWAYQEAAHSAGKLLSNKHRTPLSSICKKTSGFLNTKSEIKGYLYLKLLSLSSLVSALSL